MFPHISQQTVDFYEGLRPALLLLSETNYCAADLEQSRWAFAVEIDELRALGLSKNQIRWLVHKGYALYAREATAPSGSLQRKFCACPAEIFHPRTCFILSELGDGFVRERFLGSSSEGGGQCGLSSEELHHFDDVLPPLTPHWDRVTRVFRVGADIVKHFKVPAANQELILNAFEEEGWPSQIYDPLPPAEDIDPKRRLHDTINRLNRNQRIQVIRFCGDGNGIAVSWRLLHGQRALAATDSPPNCT